MAAGEQEAKTPKTTRPRPGDWAIAAFMLAFFALGYLLAQEWPFRAALFPQIVSTIGFLLTLLKMLGLARQAVRGRRGSVAIVPSTMAALVEELPDDTSPEAKQVRTAAVAGAEQGVTQPAEGTAVTIVDDEAEEDESMEYVFATAGGRAWSAAIAWVVAFFVAFFALGVFVAVPLFALLYLRFSGGASWRASIVYAAITGVLIYVMFRLVVYIDLPTGYIPFMQV
ncbi:MAG: hypothetical protein M3P89_10465 [Actinomycetota bacterium]|nr:hypothetical protein [Actinomycetota bacterium]